MAKKKDEPTDLIVAPPENGGLVLFSPGGAMELSQDVPEDFTPSTAGTEDIRADEITLPRIGIAQGLSPEMNPDDDHFIDGLKQVDMFNPLTQRIYGRGPLYFVAIRRHVQRIEFKPRSEGGGVVDMNVPFGDRRLEWTEEVVDGAKVRMPPKATTFVENIVLLLHADRTIEQLVLSIKCTNKWNKEAADRLTTFQKAWHKGKPVPIYGKVYTVESAPQKNSKGNFGTFSIKQAGFAPSALRDYAESVYTSLEGKVINVEREVGADDDTFDTNSM